MVFIKKHRLGDAVFFQILTPYKNILLDYHAVLLGTRHRHPAFGHPPRPLCFLVKRMPTVGSVFVSSSRSLGCLFLGPTVKIYCTKPVYDQILLAYDSYKSMVATYEEPELSDLVPEGSPAEQYETVSIEDIRIDDFKQNVVFIKYGQPVALNTTTVSAISPGTHIGWANYLFLFPDQTSLLYVASYSHRRRFSIAAAPINSTYLILNRKPVGDINGLDSFSAFLEGCRPAKERQPSEACTVIVPVSMQTMFVEIFFHTLSVLEYSEMPICVVSPVFRRLEQLINIQSEWLNGDFFSIAEPFPMREYKNLTVFDDFSNNFQEGPKLVFCDPLYYSLFGGRRLFPGQIDVVIGEGNGPCDGGASGSYDAGQSDIRIFNIKMESHDREILESYPGTVLDCDSCFIGTEPDYKIIHVDKDVAVHGELLFISGTFTHSDFVDGARQELSIRDEKCWLKRLVENNVCSIAGEWVVIVKERVKFRYLNEYQIEYKRF